MSSFPLSKIKKYTYQKCEKAFKITVLRLKRERIILSKLLWLSRNSCSAGSQNFERIIGTHVSLMHSISDLNTLMLDVVELLRSLYFWYLLPKTRVSSNHSTTKYVTFFKKGSSHVRFIATVCCCCCSFWHWKIFASVIHCCPSSFFFKYLVDVVVR